MLCNSYNNLSHVDKITYIGELIHSCQSDEYFFKLGEDIIKSAKDSGVFNGVVILPTLIDNDDNNQQNNLN